MLDKPNMADPAGDPPIYTALERIKPVGLSFFAWTKKAGVAPPFFTNLRSHGNPKRQTLEKVLSAVGWTIDRFELESGLYPVQTEVRGAGAVGTAELKSMVFGESPLPPLPLYGSAQGGNLDDSFALTELDLTEVLDYLRRPAALADDADSYALTIVGDSMSPRFKPGERVGVSPRARIEIGDDIIVQLRGTDSDRVRTVLIKELVRRRADHIILKQHNPSHELRIERADIVSLHKVKGHFL